MIKMEEGYFNKLIRYYGNTLVGKILKRFEICDGKGPILKKNIKELIYETFRDFEKSSLAYSHGRESFEWNFKCKENKDGK